MFLINGDGRVGFDVDVENTQCIVLNHLHGFVKDLVLTLQPHHELQGLRIELFSNNLGFQPIQVAEMILYGLLFG